MGIDLKKFKEIENTGSGRLTGGFSVTNTASGVRIKLSHSLVEKIFLDDVLATDEDPTVQVMLSDEEIIFGKNICEEASVFHMKGDKSTPTIYSSALGRAILKVAGCKLDKNKTKSFGNPRIETLSNSETVAVISLK